MRTLLNKIKALRSVGGAHAVSFSGRPWPWPGVARFEVLCWALSVVEYKRNIGPIELFMHDDEDTHHVVGALQIDELYDWSRAISQQCRLDTRRFWAWPKIEALRFMRSPCCLLDIDAVLYRRGPITGNDVTALHEEPREWDIYSCREGMAMRTMITADILQRGGSSMQFFGYPNPSNTAVIAFMSDKAREQYVSVAQAAMERESAHPTVSIDISAGPGSSLVAMVTAEQWTLPELCSRMGYSLGYIEKLNTQVRFKEHVLHNKDVMHLWNSKRHYASAAKARDAFEQWAIRKIASICPRGHKVWDVLHRAGYNPVERIDPNTGESYVDLDFPHQDGGPGEMIGIMQRG